MNRDLGRFRQVINFSTISSVTATQLLQWRRLFRAGQEGGAEQPIGFIPAMVVPEAVPPVPMPVELAAVGAIEIERSLWRLNG